MSFENSLVDKLKSDLVLNDNFFFTVSNGKFYQLILFTKDLSIRFKFSFDIKDFENYKNNCDNIVNYNIDINCTNRDTDKVIYYINLVGAYSCRIKDFIINTYDEVCNNDKTT